MVGGIRPKMTNQSQFLDMRSYNVVRAVIGGLGLRPQSAPRKADWIATIVRGWHDPVLQRQWIEALSPAGQRALQRLLAAGSLPTTLFTAEYGAVRSPDWRGGALPSQPHTATEELYYRGLMQPTERGDPQLAPRLAIGEDLRQALLPLLPPCALPTPIPDDFPQPQAMPLLLHDVAQYLAYLHARPDLELQYGRWLPAACLPELQQRLLRPEADPVTSQRQSTWLARLAFLASAAELHLQGRITPAGWRYLRQPPAEQLRILWQACQRANAAQRKSYRQPIHMLFMAWPERVGRHLLEQPGPYTADRLTETLLGAEPALDTFLVANFADLSEVDAELTSFLDDLAIWEAAAQVTTGVADDVQTWYWLTPLGRWLLDPAANTAPDWSWTAHGTAAEVKTDGSEPAWRYELATYMLPAHHVQLSGYARHTCGPGEHGATHRYSLEADSVASAAAHSRGLPELLEVLRALSMPAAPAQFAQIQRWHAAGRSIRLELMPVVRTAHAEDLHRIWQEPALRLFLGEVLSPTTAVWRGDWRKFVRALRQAGLHADVSALAKEAEEVGSKSEDVAHAAALWLASQVYNLLGRFLPVSMPVDSQHQQTLLARLSSVQRSALQAEFRDIEERLHALLDGRLFVPPPEPSDPDTWRAEIEAAVSEGRRLEIIYWSPARNLPTRRCVRPCWTWEEKGAAYMMAYCELADAYLTFRLDRIQSLVDRSSTPTLDDAV